MSWNVIGLFALDNLFGYQHANRFRENLIALGSLRTSRFLGGSRNVSGPIALGPSNAFDYVDIELDATNLTGFTVRARVEVRTDGSVTTVTPRIQNVTLDTIAGAGVASSGTAADYSGANQKQTIAVALTAGVNKYRLQYSQANVDAAVYVIGELEIFITA